MNKMILFRLLPLVLMGVIGGGCASIQTAHRFDDVYVDGNTRPVATVVVENYGYYLFGLWPLIAGNPDRPNMMDFKLFSDTVTVQNNVAMLARQTRKERATRLANIKTTIDFNGSFSFFVVWQKIVLTSALITDIEPGEPGIKPSETLSTDTP